MGGVESTHGNGEGAIDGVRPRVSANGVALLDAGRKPGANDRSTVCRVLYAPMERMRHNSVLIRISWSRVTVLVRLRLRL